MTRLHFHLPRGIDLAGDFVASFGGKLILDFYLLFFHVANGLAVVCWVSTSVDTTSSSHRRASIARRTAQHQLRTENTITKAKRIIEHDNILISISEGGMGDRCHIMHFSFSHSDPFPIFRLGYDLALGLDATSA